MQGQVHGVTPSWGRRLVGIEGLRALAATSVLVAHAWGHGSPDRDHHLGPLGTYVQPNLGIGLTLFFVLSGFLLYRPFASAMVSGGPRPSVRKYLSNRALRILPAYLAILVLVSYVFQVANRSAVDQDHGMLNAGQFLQNAFLLQNYTPHGIRTGIGPAWSLAVEVVFYVVLPALAVLAALWAASHARTRSRAAVALVPALVLLVVGLVSKVIAAGMGGSAFDERWGATWHAVFERSFLCHADRFAYGMAAAVVVASAEHLRSTRAVRLRPLLLGAGVVIVAAAMLANARTLIDLRLFTDISALGCALVVLFVALPGVRRDPLIRLLESRAFVFVGVVSYSVYLWHEPVTFWLRDNGLTRGGNAGVPLNMLMVFAVAVGLSVLTYRFVEAPALRRKARMTPRETDRGRVTPEPSAVQAAP